MISRPYIHPAAITTEQALQIVEIIRRNAHQFATRHDPLRTEIPARNLQGPDRELLKQTLATCQQLAIDGLKIAVPIWPEYVMLQCNQVGDGHRRHADNTKLENGQWVPNHTPQRCVSAGLYLNDDYQGGDLVFPTHNLRLKPEPGTLVAFPSDESCEHEVYRVRSGRRFSIIIWWTQDASRQERWE